MDDDLHIWSGTGSGMSQENRRGKETVMAPRYRVHDQTDTSRTTNAHSMTAAPVNGGRRALWVATRVAR